MRNRLLVIWTVVAGLVATALAVVALGRGQAEMPARAAVNSTVAASSTTSPVPSSTAPVSEPSEMSVTVDTGLVPDVAAIEPLEGRDDPRPTGRIRSTGGTESDVVLDELLVATPDQATLDAFLARWNGELLDSDEPDDESGLTEHLVRIDPAAAPRDRLAADLFAIEPHHRDLRVSDERLLGLMAIAAHETAVYGTEVALNWLVTDASVRDGSITEADSNQGTDAFQWTWISATQPQAAGIDAALQLLYGRGSIANKVKIMIVDRGFFPNADFPAQMKIRKGEWYRENPDPCSNGGDCPFHGTHVTMAAMARLDNEWGIAGPAAPVAELIAMEGRSDTYGRYKDIKKVTKEERPHIINMSFGGTVTTFVDAHKRKAERWFEKVRQSYGALPFASAGNAGIDVDTNDGFDSPCEVSQVVCVGGVSSNPLARASGSNFGSDTGNGSVEIYGPMCVFGLEHPDVPGNTELKTVCGTSVASPVVAGVAALVKAANPTLSANQIWQVVRDTAHTDSLGAEVTGHNRRIDAYRAVATSLAHPYHAPAVKILAPANGQEIGAQDFVELSAEATSFAELDLPITWRRADGTILNAVPTTDPVVVGELGAGPHVFQATATDLFGNTGYESVEVVVKNVPPAVSITSPAANTYRYTVEEILLDGSSSDPDDYYQSLDSGLVSWHLRDLDTGEEVFHTVGHAAIVPGGTLDAGDYEVVFKGVDEGGAVATDTSLLTILDVPPGESLPTITFAQPLVDTSYSIGDDGTASVRLVAVASDTQDGILDGTRFRWVAEQGDTRIVLCEGGEFGGGPVTATDCSDVTVDIPLPPGAPVNNRWTITVEVEDSAGLIARKSRGITVAAVEG